MLRTLHHRLALISLLALAGCGSMEMSMNDTPGSDLSVVLAHEAQVYVAKPTLSKSAASTLDDESFPRARFTVQVQRAMVVALRQRGVKATTTSAGAQSTLRIRIAEFGRGRGFTGLFLRGGIDYSSLDGRAVLETPAGKRELVIEKAGVEPSGTETDDQTAENIYSFTTAIATRLTE